MEASFKISSHYTSEILVEILLHFPLAFQTIS